MQRDSILAVLLLNASVFFIYSSDIEENKTKQLSSALYGLQVKIKDLRGPICSVPSNPLHDSNAYLVATKVIGSGRDLKMVPIIIDTYNGIEHGPQFKSKPAIINNLSTNKDGTQLVTGLSDVFPFGCLYNIETGQTLATFGNEKEILHTHNMVLSPDEQEIWFVTDQGIMRYAVNSTKYIGKFDSHYRAISPDHSTGIAVIQKGCKAIFDVRNIVDNTLLNTFYVKNPEVSQIIISPHNDYFITLNSRPHYGKVILGSLRDGSSIEVEFSNDQNPGYAVFNKEGTHIAFPTTNTTKPRLPIIDVQGKVKTIFQPAGNAIDGANHIVWNDHYLAMFLSSNLQQKSGFIQVWKNPVFEPDESCLVL